MPNPYIERIYRSFGDVVTELEQKYNLPPRALFVQLGLHIYKYSNTDLFICNNFDIEKIDQYSFNSNLIYSELYFLINYLKKDAKDFEDLKEQSGPSSEKTKIISVDGKYAEKSEDSQSGVSFRTVSSDIGTLIQEKIHYIRAKRDDTVYEFGLYRKGYDVPFAYAAFSLLDRQYLMKLPHLKEIPKSQVYVLTRAYSFPNSPQNTMSILYAKCFEFLKNEANALYILTAVNQNLFFTGASVRASNFELIATAPMKYYYLDGIYSTRRKLNRYDQNYAMQKLESGQIMWFGKSLSSGKNDGSIITPVPVSEEMYDLY